MPRRNQGFSYRAQLGPEARGKRTLELLVASYAHSTRETWAERLARGEVELDGARATGDELLRPGVWLTWHRPPWDEPDVPRSFEVLHEDAHLLAVGKPSGLPTVPNGGFLENTLLALVQERDRAWTPMHRLGRGTSGIVLFARTELARTGLQRALREHGLEKRYLALVEGRLEPQRIDAAIGEVAHPRLGSVHAATRDGKRAESVVERVEPRASSTRAEVRIVTGRPHQIRIHLAYVGHPLVGDPLYARGGVPRDDLPALPGELGYHLHAWRLAFAHPDGGQRVEFVAPVPEPLR